MTHHPFRSCADSASEGRERRIVTNQLRKRDKSRDPCGLHVHGRREGRRNICIVGGQRESDKSCAQHRGPEEIDGRVGLPKFDGVAPVIGLEFVDIVVTSDNEPALTSLTESWSTLGAMKSGSRMITLRVGKLCGTCLSDGRNTI